MPKEPTMPLPRSPERLHALDNLRAAMMWLGIVLHVAVIHLAGPSPLPWRDNQTTPMADLLLAFIHAFRMPVFFILAGFFVALMIERRGTRAMVRNRLRRLALPFALFWPPIFALCGVLALAFMHRMARGTWGLDPALMQTAPSTPAGPSTMHMWFLWMLLWLSLGTALAHAALARLAPALPRWLGGVMARLGRTPWGLALLTLPLAGAGMLYPDGLLQPNGAFIPPWTEWLHNGLFYGFGLALYAHREALLAHYVRRWPWYAGAGLALFFATGALFEARPRGADGLPEALRHRVVLEPGAHRRLPGARAPAQRLAGLPGRQLLLGLPGAHADDHRLRRAAVRAGMAGRGEDLHQHRGHLAPQPGQLPPAGALHRRGRAPEWQAPRPPAAAWASRPEYLALRAGAPPAGTPGLPRTRAPRSPAAASA
jgi:hypothetical protein